VADNAELARVVFTLYSQGRIEDLAEHLHPNAVIVPTAVPESELHGRTEVGEFIRSEQVRRWLYEIRADRFTAIGERWVIVEGRARFSDPEPTGGFHDRSSIWLTEFEGGLLIRSEPMDSVEDARKAVQERGGSA
jgi:ketosteroid isomerase-like protein